MDTAETYILVIVALLAIYPIVMVRLVRFMQPMRLEMADLGEQLAQDEFLTADQKKGIVEMLDRAFSAWPMIVMVVMMPFIAVAAIIEACRDRRPPKMLTKHPETEADYDRFMTRFFLSTMAANPLFAVIFVFELAVTVIIAALVGQHVFAMKSFLQRVLRADMVLMDRASGAFAR